ncbi:MAG: hypothetical protein HDR49_06550 [Bacteroides sp.]|nr:hypothetical protein [Bacteroides sp.]
MSKRHIVMLLALLIAQALTPAVFGQRTTRRGLGSAKGISQQIAADTISLDADSSMLTVAGFDKPLRSGVETMFVTNHTGRQIDGVTFTIDYFDLSGRKLHSRTLTVRATIPAGETRQVSFRTWDRQQSFYYRLSSKPRRADGTPFEVAVKIRSAICQPLSDESSSSLKK